MTPPLACGNLCIVTSGNERHMTTDQRPVVACAACGKRYAWDPAAAGRRFTCTCGTVILVPVQASPPEEMDTTYDLAPARSAAPPPRGGGTAVSAEAMMSALGRVHVSRPARPEPGEAAADRQMGRMLKPGRVRDHHVDPGDVGELRRLPLPRRHARVVDLIAARSRFKRLLRSGTAFAAAGRRLPWPTPFLDYFSNIRQTPTSGFIRLQKRFASDRAARAAGRCNRRRSRGLPKRWRR